VIGWHISDYFEVDLVYFEGTLDLVEMPFTDKLNKHNDFI